jgi:hypothetical protein
LVSLNLSSIDPAFRVLDLLSAVSMLSDLKIFYFPWSSLLSSTSDESEILPEWPDSLETFHIPSALETCYLLAFSKVPASLTRLIIRDGIYVHAESLDIMFGLIGPQILTLKVEYSEGSAALVGDILSKFPNLLHLSIRPCFASGPNSFWYQDLGIDHPLRSITIKLSLFDRDEFDLRFLDDLEAVLDDGMLPNIRNLLLSSELGVNPWVSFFREKTLPENDIKLLDISTCLKRRGSSVNGLKDSGVWLVDGWQHNDTTICEFTKENLARIRSGVPM